MRKMHDAEDAPVNGNHRAVPAEVLAAARGFGVADAPRAVLDHQLGVSAQGRQALAVRNQKLLAVRRNDGGLLNGPGIIAGEPPGEVAESGFEFAAQDRADPRAAQQAFVQRGVEPIGAEVGARIDGAYTVHQAEKQLGGGVHRKEKRDQARTLHRPAGHGSDGNIRLRDVVAVLAQPRGRRSQAERLAAHFVGGDEQHLHTPIMDRAGPVTPTSTIFFRPISHSPQGPYRDSSCVADPGSALPVPYHGIKGDSRAPSPLIGNRREAG